jgi:hypothetical protein
LASAAGPDLANPSPGDLAGPGDMATSLQDMTRSGDLAQSCINGTAATTSGHHNAGAACLGCHVGGGGPTRFYFAGTLYNKVSGGTAVAGATVEVTDKNGQVVRIVTSMNGNFYSTTPVTFPLTTRATACPSSVAMVGTVADGNCNNCHTSQMRVHLP